MKRSAGAQRGFTLIEIMVVVAIIGILAAIVVPNWVRETRKGKYDPEITAMMAEISMKEEAYKSEQGNGAYLPTTACPAGPSQSGVNFNTVCVVAASPWQQVRISATDTSIRCSYAVTAGPATTAPSPPAPFTFFAAPSGAWYYIVATCDMDGQGGTNATFFQSSIDNKLQKANYGQ